MQQFYSLLSWRLFTAQHVSGDSRAVFVVGPVITGPTTNTARLSPRYEGKTRGCPCSHWAPDDGQGNARDLLSCKMNWKLLHLVGDLFELYDDARTYKP
jgi:hypothetical protein